MKTKITNERRNNKMIKTKLKENKGITLIALVITIIVLLILAGVSIAMLTGESGILTQANNAKIEQSHGTVREGMSLVYNEYQIEINTASNEKISSTKVVKIQGKKENSLAIETDFLTWLVSKGYAESDGKLNVEKLTGSKQALGNGKEEKIDVYIIEKENEEYVVKYYEEPSISKKIWEVESQKSIENDGNLEKVQINCWLDDEKIDEGKILIYSDENHENLIQDIPLTGNTIELKLDTGCYYVDFEGMVAHLNYRTDKSFTIVKTNKNIFDYYFYTGAALPDSGENDGLSEVGIEEDGCISVEIRNYPGDKEYYKSNVKVDLYEIGYQTEDGAYMYKDKFMNMGLKSMQEKDIRFQTKSLVKAISEYANNNIEYSMVTQWTDGKGSCKFSYLEEGKLYLVTFLLEEKYYGYIVPLPWIDEYTNGIKLIFTVTQ